jgi:hypothetical protein
MARARGQGRKCEHVFEDGRQCGSWALKATYADEDGTPLCRVHSIAAEGPEALSLAMSRMARAGGVKRRREVEPAARSDIDPNLTLADVLEVVRPMLSATFEHNGQPDLGARGLAALIVVTSFPRYLRDTPERVRELLAEVLPPEVDAGQLETDAIFKAARDEWWALPAYHPLHGLVARELPRSLVPPWLDYTTVVRR